MKLQTLTTILGVAVAGQRAVRCASLVAGLLAGFQAQAAPPLYAISPHPTISDTTYMATNNNWQAIVDGAVGEAFLDTPSRRSSFQVTPTPANLARLSTVPAGINDIGQVVGYFSYSTTSGAQFYHAFLFSGGANGVATDLNSLLSLPSTWNSTAYAINNAGQVVGTYYTTDKSISFLYGNGTFATLDFSGSSISFTPAAINNNTAIAGTCRRSPVLNRYSVCIYSGGSLSADLGTLGSPFDQRSEAAGINDNGQVAGNSFSLADSPHAFLYTPGTGLVDLGTLGGGWSRAYGINNTGQVAGTSVLADNVTTHGFLYSDGVVKDVNALLAPNQDNWVVISATAINNAGQISGLGRMGGVGAIEGVLLTPIPSANTCLLNWAESQFPALFPPSAAETLATWVYAYRHYPTTNAYLAISSINNHVYYLGANGIMQDGGPGSQWLTPSNCPQQSPFPTECLLNWAESNYPSLFAPSGAATAGFGVYTNRNYYYTSSHPSYTALGISSVDNHIYYMDSSRKIWDVGPTSQYLSLSGCQ